MAETPTPFAGDRLAKIIARAGLCSRRDAELWIKEGRVAVNGKVIRTPAFNITEKDQVKVDGQPLAARQGTRVWLYHKPQGLVVTEKDPEGRPTVFETLEEQGLPRVVSIGRLDINTEGLLLLTKDGGLKRVLELTPPAGCANTASALSVVSPRSSSSSSRTASRSTASSTVRSKPSSSASRAATSGCWCRCARARTAKSRTCWRRWACRSTA